MKGTFVFVVCGAKEHVDTLHFSLNYLKRFSKNKIIILTDSSRNEIPVVHTNIIDVRTPEEFDHHQASIYLKTGIHKYLPEGRLYCYIDSDVIALSNEVDRIFDEFTAPIRFAADHCKVNKFSPRAVHCGCLKRIYEERGRLQKAWDRCSITDEVSLKKKSKLDEIFKKLDSDKVYRKITDWRYSLAGNKFRLNAEFWFDKEDKVWYDSRNMPILFEDVYGRIEQETGLKYVVDEKIWIDEAGINVWLDDCDHLIKRIRSKFNINVTDKEWQHWNGGVFLFNDESHEFLDAWFGKTMLILKDPAWKTRDQGTLIATVWEFGIQDQPVLDKKWNFIADHTNLAMKVNEETGDFTDDNFQTNYKPAFVHVYHHFGDVGWKLWNWIIQKGNDDQVAEWS